MKLDDAFGAINSEVLRQTGDRYRNCYNSSDSVKRCLDTYHFALETLLEMIEAAAEARSALYVKILSSLFSVHETALIFLHAELGDSERYKCLVLDLKLLKRIWLPEHTLAHIKDKREIYLQEAQISARGSGGN